MRSSPLTHRCARLKRSNHAPGSTCAHRPERRFPASLSPLLALALIALALAGCGTPAHVPLTGPGLHRAIAQGAPGALHFWWLPPDAQYPAPRLLLWDGANVGIVNAAASDQSFTPLASGTTCNQVAVAPDNHAFACGLINATGGSVLVQSLADQTTPAQSLLDEIGPLAWAPDSQWLAALRLGTAGSSATCSVVAINTSHAEISPADEQVLLDSIPFSPVTDKGDPMCPVMSLAWSPDGTRLAMTLAAPGGVVLEVLTMTAPGQPAAIESRHLLPGKPLQALDSPAVPSLFWSSDGQTLAALTGYGAASEDGLFLLFLGQQTTLTGPNLVDNGAGAALAFSPDGHWLAVGAVGLHERSDNAQLNVFDIENNTWSALASMYANGNSLAWSANGGLLAAASGSQQGEVIWNWPSKRINSIIPNQDSPSIVQLGWARDDSALLFTLASQSTSPPFFDEVYAQSFPVPPGASSFAFPLWFLDTLGSLPQILIALGGGLLVMIVFSLLLVLIERGRSRRRRALIVWTLGVCVALFALLFLTNAQLPNWMAALYQPYSARLCHDAPNPCAPGATLAVGTMSAPLLLALVVILGGALFTGRKPRLVPGEGLPRPVSRAPMRPPAPPEPAPLLLPPPIDEQDTLELEALPGSAQTLSPGEMEWQE
jgi:WD40 repeat protein